MYLLITSNELHGCRMRLRGVPDYTTGTRVFLIIFSAYALIVGVVKIQNVSLCYFSIASIVRIVSDIELGCTLNVVLCFLPFYFVSNLLVHYAGSKKLMPTIARKYAPASAKLVCTGLAILLPPLAVCSFRAKTSEAMV
jgi:hypothetical protein